MAEQAPPPPAPAPDLTAAVARGTAAGKELAANLIQGDAAPESLFRAVQQRDSTLVGQAETVGLLHVIAGVLKAVYSTLQTTAQQAADTAVQSTTERIAMAVYKAVYAQQAEYMEAVDKAMRDLHAKYTHDSKLGPAPFFVPPLPPKAKRITFERGADGAITGAVLRS